jgi:hypothetical protein
MNFFVSRWHGTLYADIDPQRLLTGRSGRFRPFASRGKLLLVERILDIGLAILLLTCAAGGNAIYAFGGEKLELDQASAGESFQIVTAGAVVREGTLEGQTLETPAVRGRLMTTLHVGDAAQPLVLLPPREPLEHALDVIVVGSPDAAVARVLPDVTFVSRPLAIRLQTPDAVIVAAGALDDLPAREHQILRNLADNGTAVLVLSHEHDVFNAKVQAADAPPLTWKPDPLIDRLRNVLLDEDLQPSGELRLFEPAAEQANGLAPQTDEGRPAAMLRDGNIVLWQLPFPSGDARLTLLVDAFLHESASQ